MFKFIKIALRNIFRHKRRTFFTVSAIVLGISMLLTARGFLNGLHNEMIQGSAELIFGEIQIHTKEYASSLELMPLDKVISVNSNIEEKIKNISEITAFTYRARIGGIISKGQEKTGVGALKEKDLLMDAPNELDNKTKIFKPQETAQKKINTSISSQFIALGVDPENELKVCPRIMNVLDEGRFFTKEDNQPKNNYETVGLINRQLMKGLNLSIGDTVVLVPWDINVKIIGKLKVELPTLDKKLIYLPLKVVQNMLYERNYAADNNSIHEILIKTKNIDEKDVPLVQLKKIFADKNWSIQGWEDFITFFSELRRLQNIVFWIVLLIIIFIVSTSIINTSLMSVMERTREIGTLLTMGYERKHIVKLFLMENLAVGFLGGIAGIILGSIIVSVVHSVGVTLEIPGSKVTFTIRPEINLVFILITFGVALTATLFAAVYPSYHASKLKPVEALSAN